MSSHQAAELGHAPRFLFSLHTVSPILRLGLGKCPTPPGEENCQQPQLTLHVLFPSGILILLVLFASVVLHTVFKNMIL